MLGMIHTIHDSCAIDYHRGPLGRCWGASGVARMVDRWTGSMIAPLQQSSASFIGNVESVRTAMTCLLDVLGHAVKSKILYVFDHRGRSRQIIRMVAAVRI